MLGPLLATAALVAGQGPEPWLGTYDSQDFHVNSSYAGTVRVNGQDVVSAALLGTPACTDHVHPAPVFLQIQQLNTATARNTLSTVFYNFC